MPWLTPDTETGTVYRSLVIPEYLVPHVTGCLLQLSERYNWEAFGDMSIDDTLAAVDSMLEGYFGGFFMLGLVFPWVGDVNELPDNFIVCDGASYNRVDYPDLYAVLADTYIDDADTFHTPNLVGRFVMGAGENEGATGGESEHTLIGDEMPPHHHTIPGESTFPYGEIPEVTVVGGVLTQDTSTEGGGAPHNNLPPYHGIVYVMVAR